MPQRDGFVKPEALRIFILWRAMPSARWAATRDQDIRLNLRNLTDQAACKAALNVALGRIMADTLAMSGL
jgi:outer membrane receptor for monomeric catechols